MKYVRMYHERGGRLTAGSDEGGIGGVTWTLKDGIVFDAQALLREAEGYVQQEKARLKTASGSAPD